MPNKAPILVLTFLLTFFTLHAQNDTSGRQYAIQVHGKALVYVFGGMDFEMLAWEREGSITGISLGFGIWDEGYELPLHLVTLWNKHSVHHAELDYGINLLVYPEGRVLPLPTLTMGYRYQDLSKRGFMFRAGIGIMPYLGIGYAF